MMKLRKQVVFTQETWDAIENLTKQANDGFKLGHITYSDTINEMVLNPKVNADALRSKHTNVKRTLRSWASKKELDISTLIKDLSELRNRSNKKYVTNMRKEGA